VNYTYTLLGNLIEKIELYDKATQDSLRCNAHCTYKTHRENNS